MYGGYTKSRDEKQKLSAEVDSLERNRLDTITEIYTKSSPDIESLLSYIVFTGLI